MPVMSSEQRNARAAAAPAPKSPIFLALAISFAIAAGTMVTTLDPAPVEDFVTGKWLTQPLVETQQRQAQAITTLESTVGAITKDIDFVAARVSASVRRNDDQVSERFARLDGEIAALKSRLAGVQTVHYAPPAPSDALVFGAGSMSGNLADTGDVSGLRTSLHELSAAHTGAVAAIFRRLDRIETMVGVSTDVMSSAADPQSRWHARREAMAARVVKKQKPAPQIDATRPDQADMFSLNPARAGAPLRLSRLPD
jgi:hypothetical protein